MPTALEHNDPFLSHSQPHKGQSQKVNKTINKTLIKSTVKKPAHKKEGSSLADCCCLVLLPWLEFVIITSLFLFLHTRASTFTWVFVFTCLVGSFVMIALALLGRRNLGYYYALGVSCIVACVLAACLGMIGYQQYMRDFWWMNTGRHYTALTATTPAAARSDASWLHFGNGSRVDTAKSVGFRDGSVYCAAPVLDDTQSTRVNYWAVGQDCCLKISGFSCDDAMELGAESAVVLLGEIGGFTAREKSDHAHYLRAIRQAEAAHGLVSADGALLLRWVRDPKEIRWQLLNNGLWLLGVGAAFELVLSLVLSTTLPRPNKAAELP